MITMWAQQNNLKLSRYPVSRLSGSTGKLANWQTGKQGQALAELAIFGSIFLLIIGALVSYGLRYNFEQSAKMQAFRAALRIAADPQRGSGSYALFQEKHIPDPMDTYGIGSSTLISAASSVTRDYRLDSVVWDKRSLPVTVTDIALDQTDGVTSAWTTSAGYAAGFRLEYNVPKDKTLMNKYALIYGQTAIVAKAKDGLIKDGVKVDWVKTNSKNAATKCIESHDQVNPDSGEVTTVCDKMGYEVLRIMDTCSGEMADYSACYNLGRMILDKKYCTDDCNAGKIKNSDLNCKTVCNVDMYPGGVGLPWYLQGWEDTLGRNKKGHILFKFKNIDAIFQLNVNGTTKNLQTLGLQQYSTEDSTRDETFTRTETGSEVSTEEDADWRQSTTRAIVYNDNLDGDGYDKGSANPVETPVTTVIAEGSHASWQTGK